jgi:hypothetical protein
VLNDFHVDEGYRDCEHYAIFKRLVSSTEKRLGSQLSLGDDVSPNCQLAKAIVRDGSRYWKVEAVRGGR